jgi:hypothetical protein
MKISEKKEQERHENDSQNQPRTVKMIAKESDEDWSDRLFTIASSEYERFANWNKFDPDFPLGESFIADCFSHIQNNPDFIQFIAPNGKPIEFPFSLAFEDNERPPVKRILKETQAATCVSLKIGLLQDVVSELRANPDLVISGLYKLIQEGRLNDLEKLSKALRERVKEVKSLLQKESKKRQRLKQIVKKLPLPDADLCLLFVDELLQTPEFSFEQAGESLARKKKIDPHDVKRYSGRIRKWMSNNRFSKCPEDLQRAKESITDLKEALS